MTTVSIYGTDTWITPDTNGEVAVTSITGTTYTSVTFASYLLDPDLVIEGDVTEGGGRYKNHSNVRRKTYVLKTQMQRYGLYPDFLDSIDLVLAKKNIYLQCTDYAATIHESGKAIPVVVTGFDTERVGLSRVKTIELQKAAVQ